MHVANALVHAPPGDGPERIESLVDLNYLDALGLRGSLDAWAKANSNLNQTELANV